MLDCHPLLFCASVGGSYSSEFKFKMTKSTKTRVSAEELEALIKDWGVTPGQSIDKFFPFRCWYLFIISFIYGCWLLFATDSAVHRMTTESLDGLRMWRFLYFRGWYIAGIMAVGFYSYVKNWYPAIFFSAFLVAAGVNLVFDMFNVYAEVLSRPTPQFTLMLIARFIALWFLFLNAKNSGRIPEVGHRLNPFILFKRGV